MMKENDTAGNRDPFQLSRFTEAQKGIYDDVLAELGNGKKRTHWMWFIFPQIDGLGHSPAARYYAIRSIEEARQYLNHPVLGKRLVQCAEAVLAVEGRSASEIFGYPDDMKLKSSMTLFALVASPQSIFSRVLDKYFRSEQDVKTLSLAKETGKGKNT